MIRALLTPRWLAWHALVVVAFVAFVAFGRWQLAAYEGVPDEPRDAARVRLAALLEPGQRLPDSAAGRRVSVTGEYDERGQLLVPGREHDGDKGFLVVTPLRTGSGVVAVNRGWVDRPTGPPTAVPRGQVTVHGVLQPSEPEHEARVDLLTPLPPDQVPYLATVQLLDALPYPADTLYDGFVVLTAQQPPSAVSPEPVEPARPDSGAAQWRNLAYALQWWLFAGAAVFFWAFVIRRHARESRSTSATTFRSA